MSIKIICDKCGCEIDTEYEIINIGESLFPERKTFCIKCFEKIINFIENEYCLDENENK